jgi:hypothetical protein
MNITGNFHELRDQSEDFSSELDCGWNGFPENGGLTIRFNDKDEDDFEWSLELNFQPVTPGGNMSMGADVVLTTTSLKLTNDGTDMGHDINIYPENLPTFSHVAAVVLQARKLKPKVSVAQKAAKLQKKTEEKMKKQLANMGVKV